jgi:putative copper export protein
MTTRVAAMARGPQRYLLGALFLFLAASFAGIALGSLRDGDSASKLVTALAAGVIAFWLGGLAFRALRPR